MSEIIDVSWGVEVWNMGPGIGNEYYPRYLDGSSIDEAVDPIKTGDSVDEVQQGDTEAV